MSERTFEHRFRLASLMHGWHKCIKLVDPSQRGAPDRLLLGGPPVKIVFVELKLDDGEYEPGQQSYHEIGRAHV